MERFYDAWYYLNEHPIFEWKKARSKFSAHYFDRALDIDVMKVSPRSKTVTNDPKKNTMVEIWLECGPLDEEWSKKCKQPIFCHDTDLDCGAATFEEAIIKLARLVKKHYGKTDNDQGLTGKR